MIAYGILVWVVLCSWAGFCSWVVHTSLATRAEALGRNQSYLTWLAQNQMTWEEVRHRALGQADHMARRAVLWWLLSAVLPVAFPIAASATVYLVYRVTGSYASIRRAETQSGHWIRHLTPPTTGAGNE